MHLLSYKYKFLLGGGLFLLIFFVSGCGNTIQPVVFGENVTDVDGNVYHTVIIGTQTWMVENLKVTHFNDSTPIQLVEDSAKWTQTVSPAYCWYNNDSVSYKDNFGALYNWYAVQSGKLAPKGWHVATDQDWFTLEAFVAGFYYKTGSLSKILGSTNFWSYSPGSTSVGFSLKTNNISGFTAVPGGWKINDKYAFAQIDSVGAWWSSVAASDTTAISFEIHNNSYTVGQSAYKFPSGLSVRCIKN